MGEEFAAQVVADAGPIIHLHEIGQLRLLGLFAATHSTATVVREVESRVLRSRVMEIARFQVHEVDGPEVDQVRQLVGSQKLHSGELECLALCKRGDFVVPHR